MAGLILSIPLRESWAISKSMPKSLEEKLKEEIKKTGFPLEIFSASIFKKYGWNVTHNPNYFDREENKTIPLDLRAGKRYKGSSNKMVNLMILAECKKGENKPWIFFQTNFQPNTDFDKGLIKCDDESHKLLEIFETKELSGLNVFKQKRKARTYFEAFKKEDKKKTKYSFDFERGIDIFSSAIKLAKGTIHFMQKLSDHKSLFFYPVIIFDGKLFDVSIQPGGQIDPTETNYLQLDFFFSPIVQKQVWVDQPHEPTWESRYPYAYVGQTLAQEKERPIRIYQPTLLTYQDIEDDRFSIDIVRKDFLEDYLKNLINNDAKFLLAMQEGRLPKNTPSIHLRE